MENPILVQWRTVDFFAYDNNNFPTYEIDSQFDPTSQCQCLWKCTVVWCDDCLFSGGILMHACAGSLEFSSHCVQVPARPGRPSELRVAHVSVLLRAGVRAPINLEEELASLAALPLFLQ